MALYGLGAALQAGLEGYDKGQRDLDADRMRHEQLTAAETANRLNKATADETIGNLETASLFKSAFKTNLDKFTDPDFSEQTNFSRAGLEAAKQTRSPELIQKYLSAYSDGVKQDVFARQVEVINQVKSGGGPADPTQLNMLAKKAGVPIEIQSITPEGIVAKGPNGVRTFTLQGYMNEAARAINPSTAYGNVQAQLQNEQGQKIAEAEARRKVIEKQQEQTFDLEKQDRLLKSQQSIADKNREIEMSRGDERERHQRELEILQAERNRLVAESNSSLAKDRIAHRNMEAEKEAAKAADDPKIATGMMVARLHLEQGKDPGTTITYLKEGLGLTEEQVAKVLLGVGHGTRKAITPPAPDPSPYGLTN